MRPKQPRDALGRFMSEEKKRFEQAQGFKGYDMKLRCTRSFQYAIGGSYTTDGRIVLCVSGFHCCDDPLGPFTYYTPGISRYTSVTVTNGIFDRETGKMVARGIRVGNEYDLDALELSVQMRCKTQCTGGDVPTDGTHVWYKVVAEPTLRCHVLTTDYSYLEPATDYRMYGLLVTAGRNRDIRSYDVCPNPREVTVRQILQSLCRRNHFVDVKVKRGNSDRHKVCKEVVVLQNDYPLAWKRLGL